MPAFVGGLNDPEWRVRQMAAYLLGCLGPAARAAAPALAQAREKESKRVVIKQIEAAIERIGR